MKGRGHLFSILFLLAVVSIAWSCAPPAQQEAKPVRIGVANFSHETCTFCPRPTGIEEWEFYGPPERGQAVLDRGGYIQGFTKVASEFDGVELVGLLSPRGAVGGSFGSWITKEAFDKYTNGIVEDIKQYGPFDGIYLALHGAMAVTDVPKPEAEIARRVRAAVGPDVPIVGTFDPHGNEDHEFLEAADGAFCVKRYPHYDSRLQGERAARYMVRMIKGDYKPTTATRKPGVITPSVYQGTGVSPAKDIMERARRWENREMDAYVSVFFGFAYADVPDAGATIEVMTNNDQELADRIADDMNEYIWRVRKEFAGRVLPKTKEGVAQAIAAAKAGKTPVVIADHADRSGNSSWILEELIAQGASNFCITTISDEKALDEIAGAKVGDTVKVNLGGYLDKYAGNPVPIEGKVEFLGKYGRFDQTAVLLFGDNNRVIITPTLHQVTTPDIFEDLNIDIDELDIIALKSRVHFRRGFHETGLAGAIIEVDAPGWGPADLTVLPYENIPKDMYPVYTKE